MSPIVALFAFAVAAAVLIVTPGVDTALVLRTTAVEGPRRGAHAALGICCGLLAWGLSAALGLSAVLAASRMAYAVLRVIGAAWLVWLGLNLFMRPHRKPPDPRDVPRADRGTPAWFARGLLSNLTNPKVGVFYVTFLPQFVPPGVTVAPWVALLVVIHLAETLVWFVFLIAAARSIARLFLRPAVVRALDRITGLVLLGAGLRLAAEGRR